MFKLDPLPYEKNALEPHMSTETLEYHYGKHNQTYVTNLNKLITDEYKDMSLEEIVKKSSGGIFNNAAQIWNHKFFWQCLTPNSTMQPKGELLTKINDSFGSFDEFKAQFKASALGNFGSGWTWLVLENNKLSIVNTDDGDNPLTKAGQTPLLGIDVWEHSYYIDYRNARDKYLDAFWNIVNWDYVESNLG